LERKEFWKEEVFPCEVIIRREEYFGVYGEKTFLIPLENLLLRF